MKIIEICLLVKRIINFISRLKNIFIFAVYGVHIGKHCVVHGHIGIRIGKKASVVVGNEFYYSSGSNINPLCARDRGFICVNDDAKLIIGDNVAMSSTRIWCHQSITIGDNVLVGGGCTILDSDCHSLSWMDRRELITDMRNKHDAPIVIGNDVLIGMNTMILKGVTIGERSIIGAGSVVTQNIPADSVAAGNPAVVIRSNK